MNIATKQKEGQKIVITIHHLLQQKTYERVISTNST